MNRSKGILMIVVGAMMWGASGPMMEALLQMSEMPKQFLVILRLLVAGAAILIVLHFKGVSIMAPIRRPFALKQLLIFGVFGMLGVQYTFLGSIESSNAVIATLFQFVAPVYIILFVSIMQKALPPVAQVLGMGVTLVGLFLLLTNGTLDNLTLSYTAILWGLALGFTFTFYTLYPARLMHVWGVLLVVGWGMVVGGIALLLRHPLLFFKSMPYLLDLKVTAMVIGIIIIGTLAFILFLGSMKYITPVETSVLSSFEPLTAMVISMIWFGTRLDTIQLVGAVTMLLGVTFISLIGNKIKEQPVEPNM